VPTQPALTPGAYYRPGAIMSPTASPGWQDDLPGNEADWERCNWWPDVYVYAPKWPLSQFELARLANLHEPKASSSPPGFRLATCVVCERPMVSMWHLWLADGGLKKEIHMCHACATDVYGAPTP